MSGVKQSGEVTPGHMAVFVTDQIIGDGGSPVISQRVLGTLRMANFFDTNDQPILLPERMVAFQLTSIIVTGASTPLSTAVGGFYTAAFKGGDAIVDASQAYSALTDDDVLMSPTLTAFAQTARFSRANLPDWAIYLSLTTGQVIPATADVFLIGIDLS